MKRPATSKVESHSGPNTTRRFPFLDFFAGSGLVTEALRAAFQAVWANDNAENKAAIYAANHGDRELHVADVASVSGKRLPAAALSWASFPCQDLSLAGN